KNRGRAHVLRCRSAVASALFSQNQNFKEQRALSMTGQVPWTGSSLPILFMVTALAAGMQEEILLCLDSKSGGRRLRHDRHNRLRDQLARLTLSEIAPTAPHGRRNLDHPPVPP